jgi:DNA-binding NtrC family response regulator
MIAETAQSARVPQLPIADFIFGTTPGMKEVRATLETAQQDDLPVLIEGESGTGKEVIARYLHLRSQRAAGPFVRVNCGAIPARQLEVEMFGGELGANDASGGNPGSCSVGLAESGTLFLDGIAELDLGLQQRVVQVLKSGRCGTGERKPAGPRIVCATTIDVETAISQARAPQSLSSHFGHRVRLLPLRERKQDMPQLCEYLLAKFARSFGRPVPQLSPYVLESFRQWDWPGNIRELENWIARMVIFGTEEAIGLEFRRQVGAREAVRHHSVRGNENRVRRIRRHG